MAHSCDNFFTLAEILARQIGDGSDASADAAIRQARPFYAQCQANSATQGLNSALVPRKYQNLAQSAIDHIDQAVEAGAGGDCARANDRFERARRTVSMLPTGKKWEAYTRALRYAEVSAQICKQR